MAIKAAVSRDDRISWNILLFALLVNFVPPNIKLKLAKPLTEILLLPNRVITSSKNSLVISRIQNQQLAQIACELAVENARLRSMLRDNSDTSAVSVILIPAQIIARDMNTLRRFLLVDRGANYQVNVGSIAIIPEGVVGRIIAVSQHQALIQTILEPEIRVAVMNSRNGELAICRPQGGDLDLLLLDYVHPNASFEIGDTILTSGLGGVFPKGLKIGSVIEVSSTTDVFKRVVVRPFAPLSRIDGVYIINPLNKNSQTSDSNLELEIPE